MKKPLTAILIGAGRRGLTVYGEYALKNRDKLRFIAVAEPIEIRRKKFASLHNIPLERCYKSWDLLLKEEKIADIVFICTQDQMHTEPTIEALDKGYNVFLEKPMAHTLRDCIKIDSVSSPGWWRPWCPWCSTRSVTDFTPCPSLPM